MIKKLFLAIFIIAISTNITAQTSDTYTVSTSEEFDVFVDSTQSKNFIIADDTLEIAKNGYITSKDIITFDKDSLTISINQNQGTTNYYVYDTQTNNLISSITLEGDQSGDVIEENYTSESYYMEINTTGSQKSIIESIQLTTTTSETTTEETTENPWYLEFENIILIIILFGTILVYLENQ